MSESKKTKSDNLKDEKVSLNENSLKEDSFKDRSFKNKVFINFNGLNIAFELMEKQSYKNIEMVPFKSDAFAVKDFLTLKKGYEMGLVEIKEHEKSHVNNVLCKNNAVVPLLLIDGDEITGAMQNRIINQSMLIPANSSLNISVSCTEHDRWEYKSDKMNFEPSDYSLDLNTRRHKSHLRYNGHNAQSTIWNSIRDLEDRGEFKSKTSALNDHYKKTKSNQDDYVNNLNIREGQTGAIFFINGEFKGIELFYNHTIFKEYFEKTLRSYAIEAVIAGGDDSNMDEDSVIREIHAIFDNLSQSEFKLNDSVGLGENYSFLNDDGSGSGLVFEDELIHMNYLINPDMVFDVEY